jgi:hypothetical protein
LLEPAALDVRNHAYTGFTDTADAGFAAAVNTKGSNEPPFHVIVPPVVVAVTATVDSVSAVVHDTVYENSVVLA